jgi:transcriptional regulator with XRE-family HTH domain
MSSATKPHPYLAAAIRRARQQRGITQEALAFNANMTVSTLARIERGRSDPLFTTLVKLADALQIPLRELIGAAEDGKA